MNSYIYIPILNQNVFFYFILGDLLNGHRLVEFAATDAQQSPSLSVSFDPVDSQLHVRNAYIWVKMSLRSGKTQNQHLKHNRNPNFKNNHHHFYQYKKQQKVMASSPSITLWVFRVIEPFKGKADDNQKTGENQRREERMWASAGEPMSFVQMHLLGDTVITWYILLLQVRLKRDFGFQEFDARSEIAGSKVVQITNVGWQRIDITSTVRKWYGQQSMVGSNNADQRMRRLRLLIDCSGCGDRVILHLFNNQARSNHEDRYSNHLHQGSWKLNLKQPSSNNGEDHRPFLVVFIDPARGIGGAKRVRRRAVDCTGAAPRQCCKEKFYVDFRELGWDDWIIAPHGYYANYCRGDCSGPRSPDQFQSYHSHVLEEYRKMDRLSGLQPCCAPIKFSSMSLIYFEEDQKIVKRDLPKMVVDECGCP